MGLIFKDYRNRDNESIRAVRLCTEEDMVDAYLRYLIKDNNYILVGKELIKGDKAVALGDYLVIKDGKVFTEVDGMFRITYYPASFTIDEARLWQCSPTLVLQQNDTAEEALEVLKAMETGGSLRD